MEKWASHHMSTPNGLETLDFFLGGRMKVYQDLIHHCIIGILFLGLGVLTEFLWVLLSF